MKFYVYELRDENGVTFYVGKGQGRRAEHHETRARLGDMSHRCCKIRQIWARGGSIQRATVFETDDEAEAFAEEKRRIALHGREALTNKTDGGDGPSNPSPDVRARIAAGRRGCIASEHTRELQRKAKLGTHRSAETKAKISRAQRGRKRPHARRKEQRGSANAGALLDEARVREILRRVATGERQAHLARLFGVSVQAINGIVKRRNWKHVSLEESDAKRNI